MVNYSSIYPGATYLLDPSYNYIGYRIPTEDIGGTTSIQTANQLKEVSKLLNQGMKVTELSVVQPEVFEMMPKEHLTEIKRLNELTGAESTLHAPILDPSGFTEQGWNEENREAVERQFSEFVKRSHDLSPKGNIPVTIHASNFIPGALEIPKTHELVTEEERKKAEPVYGMRYGVEQETGRLVPLQREKVFYPGRPEKGEIFKPEERLDMLNRTNWSKEISNLAFYKKEADEILNRAQPDLQPLLDKIEEATKQGKPLVLSDEEHKRYDPALAQLERSGLFLRDVALTFNNLYEKAAKYGEKDKKVVDPNDGKVKTVREILKDISNKWNKFNEDAQKGKMSPPELIIRESQLLDKSLNALNNIPAPKQYTMVEDFARKKASETLSNVAVDAYKKYGEKAPIVSIENPPYGGALSSGRELKELVKATRQKFIDKLVKEGKSRSEAKRAAERLIGVTWDTSHINMIRRQGFGPEKITKETKEVAPMVKHLHYNDNFGSTHTDLPPGMGSVPMRDVLKELEKGGFAGKRIFEGGNFFQHFQQSPFFYTLESAGAPVYITGEEPFWNQMGYLGQYYGGHGPINPTVHHSIYGAGFQTLPLELGGEIPGGQSRFAGTPNQ